MHSYIVYRHRWRHFCIETFNIKFPVISRAVIRLIPHPAPIPDTFQCAPAYASLVLGPLA
jgi:hypothetical protein